MTQPHNCIVHYTYVTPTLISRQNQKNNTTPQLYGTLITSVVCKTKTYFPQEQKTDTTAQPEKSSSSPRVASVFDSLSVFLSVSKGQESRVKECYGETGNPCLEY